MESSLRLYKAGDSIRQATDINQLFMCYARAAIRGCQTGNCETHLLRLSLPHRRL